MEKHRTDCNPGLTKQDGVPGLSGVQQPLKYDNSANTNHDKKPEGFTIVKCHSEKRSGEAYSMFFLPSTHI